MELVIELYEFESGPRSVALLLCQFVELVESRLGLGFLDHPIKYSVEAYNAQKQQNQLFMNKIQELSFPCFVGGRGLKVAETGERDRVEGQLADFRQKVGQRQAHSIVQYCLEHLRHMKKQAQIPIHTQQFLLSKISKVQEELNKLSTLISNDEQLNNQYIKKFLQEQHISSCSSDGQPQLQFNPLLSNIQEQVESSHNNEQDYVENQTFSQTISKLSYIKNKENDTTAMLKVEGDGLLSTLNQVTNQNNRIQENQSIKFNITKKPNKLSEEHQQAFRANFLEFKSKPKASTNSKPSKRISSANRSKRNLPNKKSHKQLPSPYLSKRKSTKALGGSYKNQSNHLFQDMKKVSEKYLCSVESPKLSKINVNRFKQNLKKTIEIQNEQEGLQSKFHLNLSQHKSLMQRAIQKSNFQTIYEAETKKYEKCMKQLTESLIMAELDFDFKQRSESLKLIMVFLSQFSQTIRKFFKNKPQQIELKFNQLIKETIMMLIKLPSKLYKNNYVSFVRYSSLIGSKTALHKPSSKLQQAVQCLKEYITFLSKSGLIEMTERQIPHSDRKMLEYYSHRSKQQKPKIKGKFSDDIQEKVFNKLYDTERRFNNTDTNLNQLFATEDPKKVKSPEVKTKAKVIRLDRKIPPKGKPTPSFGLIKAVKSQETLKPEFRTNTSGDLSRKKS